MRKLLNFLMSIVLLFFLTSAQALSISNYHQVFLPGVDQQNQLIIAIRYYYQNDQPYFLIVNPYTFATQAIPAVDFASRKAATDIKSRYFTRQELDSI